MPHRIVVLIMSGLGGASAILGYGVSQNPLVACVVLAVFLGTIILTLAGVERFTTLVLSILPWLVILSNITPRLTLTLTCASAVLLLIARTPLDSDILSVPWMGVFLFLLLLLGHAAESTNSAQLIVAAKLSLFPAMILVTSSRTARERLIAMRPLLLGSAVGAMAAQATTSILHVGPTGNYYKSGTYSKVGVALGLTPDAPHEMALLGVIVAVACLLTIRDVRLRVVAAAVAATPALATGVRSALVALVITLLILLVKTRLRPSVILSIACIVTVVILSGVASIVIARYQHGQATGEYSNIHAAGSGRGIVETTAIEQWTARGLWSVTFGTGLGSIGEIEQRRLGQSFGAQNDVVAIMVELGVIGLIGWFLMWLALIRANVNWLVLVPVASYGLTNGAMQYVGALVFGIVLATACSSSEGTAVPSEDARRESTVLTGTVPSMIS